MDELDAGLKPKTRRKIELAIEGGWKFDKETWDASVARHKKYDMAKIFSDFDSDGDGKASFPLPPHSAPLCCSSDGCSLHCCSSSLPTPLIALTFHSNHPHKLVLPLATTDDPPRVHARLPCVGPPKARWRKDGRGRGDV